MREPEGESVTERIQRLLAWWKGSRPGRVLARYGVANGALLSGGIAYTALFSITAGLTITFTVFMAVLGGNEELRAAVIDSVNAALPNAIGESTPGGTQYLLSPSQLQLTGGLSVAGVVAVLVFLNTATGVMSALRNGLRAIAGLAMVTESAVIARLRDFGAFVALAVSVLITSALGIAAGVAGTWVGETLGLGSFGSVLTRLLSLALAVCVDGLVFMGMMRLLAGIRAPRRDLLQGAAVAALGAGVLRVAGTTLVGSVSKNPAFASFVVIVTLLLWVNYVVRFTLLAAAWTVNPAAPPVVEKGDLPNRDERPNYVTLSAPRTLTWDHDPRTGLIRADAEPTPFGPDSEKNAAFAPSPVAAVPSPLALTPTTPVRRRNGASAGVLVGVGAVLGWFARGPRR